MNKRELLPSFQIQTAFIKINSSKIFLVTENIGCHVFGLTEMLSFQLLICRLSNPLTLFLYLTFRQFGVKKANTFIITLMQVYYNNLRQIKHTIQITVSQLI